MTIAEAVVEQVHAEPRAVTEPLLAVRDLRKAFGSAVVLDGVNLEISPGETTGLIGPNGAGKTTLFNVIAGIEPPDDGTVRIGGRDMTRLGAAARAASGIGRTFQEIRLFANLTATENVLVGCRGNRGEGLGTAIFQWGRTAADERRAREQARELLDRVGLSDFADRLPDELSYGQQKRVGIARALATGTQVLFLDEPAAGLDPEATRDLIGLIRELEPSVGTILLIEHNLELVRELCGRAVFLDAGRVVLSGAPADVLGDERVWRAFAGL